MTDYNTETKKLSGSVQELEVQKETLVRTVDSRLTEGLDRQNRALERMTEKSAGGMSRRPYRDIEGEMEDYEQVDEMSAEDSDQIVDETAALPLPQNGEIDYFRQMDGEEHFWMQQITPRAGGDSMMGEYDRDDQQHQLMMHQK